MERSLAELPLGQEAVVVRLNTTGAFDRRLRQMGLCEGVRVRKKRQAPLGDPSVYMVRGSVLALRAKDAAHIMVSPAHIPVLREGDNLRQDPAARSQYGRMAEMERDYGEMGHRPGGQPQQRKDHPF